MGISKTRQMLVDVARQLFAKDGKNNVTMNDIATASQKGRRTLYTYFKNKNAIYLAVIEKEISLLQEKLQTVLDKNVPPDQKIIEYLFVHLEAAKEALTRNGSLRAEFFRDIWMVEKVRRTFDAKEHRILQLVLQEGIDKGRFRIENVGLMTDIIHYSVKGLEVPYIYDRLGDGLTEDETYPIVRGILVRVLNMPPALD